MARKTYFKMLKHLTLAVADINCTQLNKKIESHFFSLQNSYIADKFISTVTQISYILRVTN